VDSVTTAVKSEAKTVGGSEVEDSGTIEAKDKTSATSIGSSSAAVMSRGNSSAGDGEQSGSSQTPVRESQSQATAAAVKDSTEDVDETQENEHFETRQSFLNLCQGNHYQFDSLRRAKHSSMMVLYHLHNPDAPKFLAACVTCQHDILHGYRHHCEVCDLDICDGCFRANPTAHPHPLKPINVSSGVVVQSTLTDQERKQRAKSLKLHLELLLHASNCTKTECEVNCHKMKVNHCTPASFVAGIFH